MTDPTRDPSDAKQRGSSPEQLGHVTSANTESGWTRISGCLRVTLGLPLSAVQVWPVRDHIGQGRVVQIAMGPGIPE